MATLVIIERKVGKKLKAISRYHFTPKFHFFLPSTYKISLFNWCLPLSIQVKYMGKDSQDQVLIQQTLSSKKRWSCVQEISTGKLYFSLLLRLRWCFSPLLPSSKPINCVRETSTLCIVPLRLLLLSPFFPLSISADAQGGGKHLSVSFGVYSTLLSSL